MKIKILTLAVALGLVGGCSNMKQIEVDSTPAEKAVDVNTSNPLFATSKLQYQAPEFNQINDSHYKDAIEAGIEAQLKEIQAIASNSEPATFENTLVALEKSGKLLTRATSVFYNLAGTNSNETILALRAELAPKMAKHSDDIYLNKSLFERVDSLFQQRESLGLDAESKRLLEIYHRDFVLAGANLTPEQQVEIRKLNAREAELTNTFSQKLLAQKETTAILVDTAAELDGLSNNQLATAQDNAKEKGHDGKFLIYLTNTTRQPILANLNNRKLREKIWNASISRGIQGENATYPLVKELAELRANKAQLLGFDSWAHYQLAPQMAQKPQAVMEMLSSMVPKVVANTQREASEIQALIKAEGKNFELQPWDWAYYANKVRKAKYSLDENEVKAYFEFNNVLNDGVFHTMNKLYGITLKPRKDLPVYHPDVKAYEVFDKDGTSLAIFYADYFAREGKRGGAWMNNFVEQSKLLNNKPVIVNVMNIAKAPEGQPTLVSYDNVTTMFHEFGHALHGIFSSVKYPYIAGTNVSRDFVEFPSTYQEDWASDPAVLANYARHYETGKAMPKELLDKVLASRSFNMGYDTLEYMAAALLDMEWHSIKPGTKINDVAEFEAKALAKHGVNLPYVLPRYRSGYFAHIFAGGYSASYYAYMWCEILAADAFAYTQEQGGLKPENGDTYRQHILSVGNSIDPMETYKAFRGQAPTTDALLKRRGLL